MRKPLYYVELSPALHYLKILTSQTKEYLPQKQDCQYKSEPLWWWAAPGPIWTTPSSTWRTSGHTQACSTTGNTEINWSINLRSRINQRTLFIDKTKLRIKFEVFAVSQAAKSHGWISDDCSVLMKTPDHLFMTRISSSHHWYIGIVLFLFWYCKNQLLSILPNFIPLLVAD